MGGRVLRLRPAPGASTLLHLRGAHRNRPGTPRCVRRQLLSRHSPDVPLREQIRPFASRRDRGMQECTNTNTSTRIYEYAFVCAYVVYVLICIQINTRIFLPSSTHIHIHMPTHINIRVHVHTNKHTHSCAGGCDIAAPCALSHPWAV